MNRDRYKLDFVTQRFIVSRWNTELGSKVRKDVINGLKCSVIVRDILSPYVLDHPENVEPYGYPYYPKSDMNTGDFWVLTNDDLRGICLYGENFSKSESFEGRDFSYGCFFDCDLTEVVLTGDFSYTRFENCKMDRTELVSVSGLSTKILNCSAHDACVLKCRFWNCDFEGTDFTGTYFEDTILEDMTVNYLTRFDQSLQNRWKTLTRPPAQDPDILRAIRLAYRQAELWPLMDRFLSEEKTQERKHILWPQFRKERTAKTFTIWLSSLLSGWYSGYSTKPVMVLLIALMIPIAFSIFYFVVGVPIDGTCSAPGLSETTYFSFTTFATLGYGDLSYGANHPVLRILSTVEALAGVVFLAQFVVVFARKVFR
jgi:hypothetical protein